MYRPITYKILSGLYIASMGTTNTTGNPNFQYEEVVEAVRKSPYAYRFDFEKYDSEQASGHKSTDLYFKFVDKEPGSNYSYPSYKNTNLRLRRFILSTRKNRALPRIESSEEYCRYKTIEQLLEKLAVVVPRIDYLEKGILEDEKRQHTPLDSPPKEFTGLIHY